MYQLSRPAGPLRPYIENYWFVSHRPGEEVDLRVDVFVDARADLIFNFEAPYLREVIGGETRELERSNLDAQRLVPIRIRQHGFVRITGVRFRLGGVAPFTGARLAVFTGRTPAPVEVFGDPIQDLEAALAADPGTERSVALLDACFLGLLRQDPAQRAFERSLSALEDSRGRAGVNEVATAVSTSTRQVERLFARGLGIAPRTAARVLRFQHALRSLMSDPGVPLGAVAAEAGYYDQAHFVRDFRQFTGGVPRGYRGYFPADGPSDFAPNVVAYVQDPDPRGRDTDTHD